MKKFGAQTENSKKDLRAQRFGGAASPAAATTTGTVDPSVLEKRAQRFGVATNTAPSVDKEALEKRAKRFGVAANGNSEESKVFNYFRIFFKFISLIYFNFLAD